MEIVFGIGGLVLGLFGGLLPYLKLKTEITKLREEGVGIQIDNLTKITNFYKKEIESLLVIVSNLKEEVFKLEDILKIYQCKNIDCNNRLR